MNEKPFAPATERNSAAILDVLRHEFREVTTVLEIGSGTGQHAVAFAAKLIHLSWQTSDVNANHAGINAWLAEAALRNVLAPLSLDVMTARLPPKSYTAVFSANTAHIMSFAAVEKMFSLASSVLGDAGLFCLYGPFREQGRFNTRSNAEFHRSLRLQDAKMGVRDLEQLDKLALSGGLYRTRRYAMPANNLLVVWEKQVSGDNHDDT